jgi:hypothetical protein
VEATDDGIISMVLVPVTGASTVSGADTSEVIVKVVV